MTGQPTTTVVPVLEIDGLCVDFATDEGPVRAVDGVSIRLAPGERVAVVGESGSGKTVTALAIMGLIDAPGGITAGDVRLDGRSFAASPKTTTARSAGATSPWSSRTR